MRPDDHVLSTIPPWHVIQTEPCAEQRVVRWLANHPYLHVDTYYPRWRRLEDNGRGRKRVVVRSMMPGYVFTHLPENYEGRELVRQAPGVIDFLRIADTLATLSERAISWIRAVEADFARPPHRRKLLAPNIAKTLAVGDKVRVNDKAGPWAGFHAVVEALDDRSRATIKLILPERPVPVTMPAQWLKAM